MCVCECVVCVCVCVCLGHRNTHTIEGDWKILDVVFVQQYVRHTYV